MVGILWINVKDEYHALQKLKGIHIYIIVLHVYRCVFVCVCVSVWIGMGVWNKIVFNHDHYRLFKNHCPAVVPPHQPPSPFINILTEHTRISSQTISCVPDYWFVVGVEFLCTIYNEAYYDNINNWVNRTESQCIIIVLNIMMMSKQYKYLTLGFYFC